MTKRYDKELTNDQIAALTDSEIDTSDIPELDDKFWANARVVKPLTKASVTIRYDHDVVEWFKSQGKGYQTRMNAVLRAYMEAKKQSSDRL